MPSLTEVLNRFNDHKFLINFKSNSQNEADLASQFLATRPNEDLSRLSFYGGHSPTTRMLELHPQLKGFTKASVKKCAIRYVLLGWSGYVPDACRNTIMAVPKDYASYFWGWPNLLVDRMHSVNTEIILFDMVDGHTAGIDDVTEIKTLSEKYRGIVWTDKIEQVANGY